MTIIGIIALH